MTEERDQLLKIVTDLEALQPNHDADSDEENDEKITAILDSHVSIKFGSIEFITASSMALLDLLIQSAKQDLYNYDVCKHGIEEAYRLHPKFKEIY